MIIGLFGIVILFLFIIIVSILKAISRNSSNITYNEVNKEDILQEEIHAHDFTAVNLDDISQQEIHEHQPWNDEGPIKYN